tara:strand:+ start:887 stop:1177 length:291 start_codon:yes stop_codon:yes gene_type:complete
MALANKESARIHSKTGRDLTKMTDSYTKNKHIDLIDFAPEAALLHQLQLMQNDIDELRRYVQSNEIVKEIDASNLPTSKPRTRGLLYNDRGTVKVS